MFILELAEVLFALLVVCEIGIPMIFGIKFFPILRSMRSRKQLAEVKTDIENAVIGTEVIQRRRELEEARQKMDEQRAEMEREMELKREELERKLEESRQAAARRRQPSQTRTRRTKYE